MSWYDYVPGVGTIAQLAQGNYGNAAKDQFSAGSPLGMAGRWVGGQIEDGGHASFGDMMGWTDKEKGYDQAILDAKAAGEKAKNFQMEGLDRAENYYAPARAMNTAIYGSPDKLRK